MGKPERDRSDQLPGELQIGGHTGARHKPFLVQFRAHPDFRSDRIGSHIVQFYNVKGGPREWSALLVWENNDEAMGSGQECRLRPGDVIRRNDHVPIQSGPDPLWLGAVQPQQSVPSGCGGERPGPIALGIEPLCERAVSPRMTAAQAGAHPIDD